jgi:hypothetical protein
MKFTLPGFLRRTPAASLRTYFVARDLPGFGDIEWDSSPAMLQGGLRKAVEALPGDKRERVYGDLEQVVELCDDIGHRALRSMLEGDVAAFDGIESHEARGIFVLLHNKPAFDHALSIASAERLFHGRSWSRYEISDGGMPTNNPESITALEHDMRELFSEFDGSGHKIMIEVFERPGVTETIVQYSIFVEAVPESSIEFYEGQPRRVTRRPVMEAAVCYGPATGTVDIVSKGGKRAREAIGHAFAKRLLSPDAALKPVEPRYFDLECLRSLMVFDTDPADGIKHVSVRMLRLRDLASAFSRVTLEIGDADDDIHELSAEWFGNGDPLKGQTWSIEQAKLRITFHPDRKGGRERKINIELHAPNGSNLKDQTRRHEIISSKYLTRWGLTGAGRS